MKYGSLGIASTRNCITHFHWICGRRGRVLFYQGNKSDKERKIVRKKLNFMHTKRFNKFFLLMSAIPVWVQFHVNMKYLCI